MSMTAAFLVLQYAHPVALTGRCDPWPVKTSAMVRMRTTDVPWRATVPSWRRACTSTTSFPCFMAVCVMSIQMGSPWNTGAVNWQENLEAEHMVGKGQVSCVSNNSSCSSRRVIHLRFDHLASPVSCSSHQSLEDKCVCVHAVHHRLFEATGKSKCAVGVERICVQAEGGVRST